MGKLSLLVIDDDHFSLRLITEHLALHGYPSVNTVTSANEGIEWIRSTPKAPDVILCDLNMPDIDGIQFIESLGASEWDGSLILLTGEGARLLDAATHLAISLGIHVLGAIRKPIEPLRLRQMLDSYEPRAYPQIGSHRDDSKYLPGDLADAIDQDQLILHYQPQVRLADGTPFAVECLVRWRHPYDGLVYPEHFISLAEEHGLIDLLTERVIRQAIKQTCSWREAGLNLPIAINLSMDTLQRPDAVDWLLGMLEEGGVAPRNVIWEIIESRVAQSVPRTLSNLTRLSLKKSSLAIDDFGLGHSSLAQLRDLPFGCLKIDKSFVHNGESDTARRAIVTASASMAKALNIDCIAEGVETAADWTFVQQVGCTHAQGWIISRPVPAVSIPSWLERWPAEFSKLTANVRGETHGK